MDKPSRTTFLYLISGEESVDQAIYDAIQRKEDFRIELYKK
jgi:flavin-binding protein dodecin